MANRAVFLGLIGLAISSSAFAGTQSYFDDLALLQPQNLSHEQTSALLSDLSMPTLVDALPTAVGFETMAFAPVETETPIEVVSPPPRKAKTALALYHNQQDPKDAKDFSQFDVRTRDPIHVSGEMGAYFAHSSGKFGGDEWGSYIVGTAGNDKTQVTAGFSYSEFNGKPVRWSH